MNRISFLLISLLAAYAYLVCDPQAGVTEYRLNLNGIVIMVPAQPDGSLEYDVTGLSVGPHRAVVRAKKPLLQISDPSTLRFRKVVRAIYSWDGGRIIEIEKGE